jgi:hypothetical protein
MTEFLALEGYEDYNIIETQVNEEFSSKDKLEHSPLSISNIENQPFQTLKPPLHLYLPEEDSSHEYSRQIKETVINSKPAPEKRMIVVKHFKNQNNVLPKSIRVYTDMPNTERPSTTRSNGGSLLDARHHKAREKIEQMRKEKYISDMRECTYRPNISSYKQKRPIEQKHYMKPILRSCASTTNILTPSCYTFKPQTNIKSKRNISKMSEHLGILKCITNL